MPCKHLLPALCSCPKESPPPEKAPALEPPKKIRQRNAASPWSPNYQDPVTGEYPNRPKPRVQTPEEILAELLARAELGDVAAMETLRPIFDQIDAQLARACFAEFFRQAWKIIEPSTELVWNWHLGLMCAVLQAVFEDWMRAKKSKKHFNAIRNVIFNVPPGSSKPVSINGLVTEQSRGLIRVDEVRVGDRLLTHRGRYRDVRAVHEQGVLPLYTFTTARGRKVSVAGDHPMLTQRGWVRADEITTRDVFAEVHAIESGGQSVAQEEARLIGYLIGDGCLRNRAASFTNQDAETIADFQHCASSVQLTTTLRERPPSHVQSTSHATHVVSLCAPRSATCLECDAPRCKGSSRCRRCTDRRSNMSVEDRALRPYVRPDGTVGRWLDKHDLTDKNSHNKRVPRAIMSANEDVIAEYLAAYWACDGGIQDRRDLPRAGRKNQTSQTVRVDATTVSEGLARDHQALLQRLGLSFTLRRKVGRLTRAMVGKNSMRVGEDYVSWMLVASDQDTAAKFIQLIGPRMRHKKRTRASGLQRNQFDRVLNPDAVVDISTGTNGECRCFTIDEDESFVYQGVAVHNSRVIAVAFQAWCWIHWPGAKFICLSVNQDAMLRDARAARELVRSPWYIGSFKMDWTLKVDQDAAQNFGNTEGGERLSLPSKAEIVGLRGDVICIDDPNNPKGAENKNERDEINNLWSTNQANRVNDGMRSLRIGVQQRTHAADWTGNVIALQGTWTPPCGDPKCKKETPAKCCNRDGWLHVVIPAEYDPTRKFVVPKHLADIIRELGLPDDDVVFEDPRTTPGESIDPVRMPLEYLNAERKRWAGTANYANQMMQLPFASEGNKVDRSWWNFFRLASGVREDIDEEAGGRPRPAGCHDGDAKIIHAKHYAPGQWDFDWITISLDCASKKTDKGSNYGILVIAGKGGRRYILDDATQRGSLHEIIEVLVGSDTNPERPRESGLVQKWQVDSILIEPKAAGPDVMDTLLEQMAAGDVPVVAIWECEPGNTDKEMRLEAAIPYIKNGMVHILDGASWAEEFVGEVSAFPNGHFDDRVDALSQCLNFRRESEDVYPDL